MHAGLSRLLEIYLFEITSNIFMSYTISILLSDFDNFLLRKYSNKFSDVPTDVPTTCKQTNKYVMLAQVSLCLLPWKYLSEKLSFSQGGPSRELPTFFVTIR